MAKYRVDKHVVAEHPDGYKYVKYVPGDEIDEEEAAKLGLLDKKIAKGDTKEDLVTKDDLRKVEASGKQPNRSGTKAAWLAYARDQADLTDDQLKIMTVKDLADHYLGDTESGSGSGSDEAVSTAEVRSAKK